MASVVFQTDKRNGSTYAYSLESVHDPVTGKNKQKRTYIGRVDPISQKIVEKAAFGKRNRGGITKKQIDRIEQAATEKLGHMNSEVEALKKEVQTLKKEKEEADLLFKQIVSAISNRHTSNEPI